MRTRNPIGRIVLVAALTLGAAAAAHAQDAREAGARAKRVDRAPKQGAVAPDFTLRSLDGETEVSLSALRGRQPVVLIFGSYT